jgi:hypothetical protein
MTRHLVELLRETAKVLSAFSDEILPGTRTWDGNAYVPSPARSADAHAAKWWGLLSGIAELLDRQEAPLTAAQKEYLRGLLSGGMGSLTDFALDGTRWGAEATHANQELDLLRKQIFEELGRM